MLTSPLFCFYIYVFHGSSSYFIMHFDVCFFPISCSHPPLGIPVPFSFVQLYRIVLRYWTEMFYQGFMLRVKLRMIAWCGSICLAAGMAGTTLLCRITTWLWLSGCWCQASWWRTGSTWAVKVHPPWTEDILSMFQWKLIAFSDPLTPSGSQSRVCKRALQCHLLFRLCRCQRQKQTVFENVPGLRAILCSAALGLVVELPASFTLPVLTLERVFWFHWV